MSDQIGIRLQSCPTEGAYPAPALIEQVTRNVVNGLREHNQRIEPIDDGRCGGDRYQWLVTVANAAQPLLPLATFSLTIAQPLNELRKLATRPPVEHQPPTIIVICYGSDQIPVPLTSDEALLAQLLSAHLPAQIDPAQAQIDARVAPPPIEW